jgi:hypothetical protein
MRLLLVLCTVLLGSATMGPLVPDSTVLDGCGELDPGGATVNCADSGPCADAPTCASRCDADPHCSGATWTDANQGSWALRCCLRFDNVTHFRACGAGCGHASAAKTSGWVPPPPPPALAWPPLVAGWTGFIKPFWFGANSNGLQPEGTLALMARHAVAGFGWQQGHPGGGKTGREEALLAAAATRARVFFNAANASTVLFVYRQIQVCCSMFGLCWYANYAPQAAGFWLTDASGKRCDAAQPWGTRDAIWDFRVPGAADWWVNNVVDELTGTSALTNAGGAPGAVFFDECDQNTCGYKSDACDFSSFNQSSLASQQAASNAMLARTAAKLNAANIIPIFSLDNRVGASGAGLPGAAAPCALPEDDTLAALAGTTWVRFYENWPSTFWRPDNADLHAAMIANAMLEAAAGVPSVLHGGCSCPAPARNISRPGRLGGDIEFLVATYLIVADAGTTLSCSNDCACGGGAARARPSPPRRATLAQPPPPSLTRRVRSELLLVARVGPLVRRPPR